MKTREMERESCGQPSNMKSGFGLDWDWIGAALENQISKLELDWCWNRPSQLGLRTAVFSVHHQAAIPGDTTTRCFAEQVQLIVT